MTLEAQPHTPPAGEPPASSGANPPTLIEGRPAADLHQSEQTVDVGQLPPEELDALITSLGLRMVRAKRLGQHEEARRLCDLQAKARAARSPAHVAAQEAEHLRRVEEGLGYFSSEHALEQGRRAMGERG